LNKQVNKKNDEFRATFHHPLLQLFRMTYEEIYQRYAKEVYNSIYRIVQHTGEAEDILQETFVDAFEDLNHFFSHPQPAAWLKRVGINKAIGLLRKRKYLLIEWSDDLQDDQSDITNEAGFELQLSQVVAAIEKLPVGYRTIVQLYLIEDLPQHEIASMLGISHSTVRSQYFRARKHIVSIVQKMNNHG
jgi:RNA polymerase sigma factor (sigma-70 family)